MTRYLVMLAFLLLLASCASNTKKATLDNITDSPKLTKPVVRKIWVPAAIEDGGKVYRDGHYKYLLENESAWSR
jgi:uncharacterized lipoprotein YmbA